MPHGMHSCVMIITETWVNNNVPRETIELEGRFVYTADRTAACGKSKGGGLCIYVLNS